MTPKTRNRPVPAAVLAFLLLALLALGGCSDRDLTALEEAKAAIDPVVFSDAFGATLDYAAFLDSYYEALTIDEVEPYLGTAALKVDVPAGNWAGGTFWTHSPRDLSSFNALTLYAKASGEINLNECGVGLDVTNTSPNKTTITNVALDETWKRLVLPIPNPARLTNERGMFWYSESEGAAAVTVMFDEIIFANVPTISNPRPAMNNGNAGAVEALLGEVVPIPATKTTYNVDGEDMVVGHSPIHFDYISSNEDVAVAQDGVVRAVGGGTAVITAKLDTLDVAGQVTVTVVAPPSEPAATPTHPGSDVISLFSDAYDDIAVTTWLAQWSTASGVYAQTVAGDSVLVYTGLKGGGLGPYAAIEFSANQIDAASPGMTHLHLDVFATAGTMFYVKLVDVGPDRNYGGGDDTEKLALFFSSTDPAFVAREWSSLDIPLETFFSGMNFGNVAQLIVQSPDVGTLYVDNIYFHK